MALFFSNNKKRKRTAAKGNYAFRRKKKKKQPEAADIHRLEMNPETEASRRQIMLKRAGTGARWAFGMLAAILFLSLMKVVVMEAFVKNAKFQLQKVQMFVQVALHGAWRDLVLGRQFFGLQGFAMMQATQYVHEACAVGGGSGIFGGGGFLGRHVALGCKCWMGKS